MSEPVAIKVVALNKSFKLPHESQNSLKSLIINFKKRDKGYETQQVLSDISFEVKRGEFFGVVGRNGSGKSTLLKLLAGIYSPDEGLIAIDGKLTPFIELGVGFNPELSGRDNVYLNGALLGYGRKQMDTMYDDIVQFAELERFMDQKLKNYSSGMQVRLAFSIAIKSKSEILIFDEVLAVGDERFQKKCVEVFREFKKQKRTVILVTHDMGNVEKFCDRAMVLDKSRVLAITTPGKAASIYSRLNVDQAKIQKQDKKQQVDKRRSGSGEVKVAKVKLLKNDTETKIFDNGQPFTLQLELSTEKGCPDKPLLIGLAIYNDDDVVVSGPNSSAYAFSTKDKVIKMTIPKVGYRPGDYAVTIVLYDQNGIDRYDYLEKWVHFSVVSDHLVAGVVEVATEWEAAKA